MAGAYGDRQRIDAGALDEIARLLWISKHHVVGEFALRANAILFGRLAGFERAETAELTLDRYSDHMGKFTDFARDIEVVFIAGGRLCILTQRAVHHHAAEARADRLLAHPGVAP